MYQKFVYRPREAMTALGIGRTLFYDLVKDGELHLIRLSKRSTGVESSEIEKFLASRRRAA